MRKPYSKPELERLLISSVEDILAGGSPETGYGDDDINDGIYEDGTSSDNGKWD